MAATTPMHPNAARRRVEDPSEDSVDAQFGGEYSETSLDLIRSMGPKNDVAEHAYVLPDEVEEPLSEGTVERMTQAVDQYVDALEGLKGHQLPDDERAWVDYKRSLLESSSVNDLSWMKLRAYHRLMDRLRAKRGLDAAGDVPGERPRYSEAAVARTALASSTQRTTVSSSEPSEWAPGWDQVQYEPREAVQQRAQLAELLEDALAVPEPSGGQLPGSDDPLSLAYQMPLVLPQASANTSTMPRVRTVVVDHGNGRITEYLQDYMDESRLMRQLSNQRRQVSTAFVLSFSVGLGACLWKWLRRHNRPRRPAGN